MSQRKLIRRASASGVSCALALALCATPAAAKENKRAICTAAFSAYKQAVSENKAGHWREARASLVSCAEATACGGLVPRCKAFLDKLEARMSSVVPVVTDASGAPRLDVQVKVDGQLLTSRLDGMAQLIEPGPHEFTFSADQGVFATQKVLILEGQRDRPIAVTIAGQAPSAVAAGPSVSPSRTPKAPAGAKPASEDPDKATLEKAAGNDEQSAISHDERPRGGDWAMPTSVFPYVLGGVGLAGIAAGGLLTIWGNNDNSALENTCRPNCQPSSQDHVKTMYVAADISFGVGAAALAVTTFLIATSRSAESVEKPAAHEALRVGIEPTRSGAFASVSGAF